MRREEYYSFIICHLSFIIYHLSFIIGKGRAGERAR